MHHLQPFQIKSRLKSLSLLTYSKEEVGVNPQNVVSNRNVIKDKQSHESILKGRAHLRCTAHCYAEASRLLLLGILRVHSRQVVKNLPIAGSANIRGNQLIGLCSRILFVLFYNDEIKFVIVTVYSAQNTIQYCKDWQRLKSLLIFVDKI